MNLSKLFTIDRQRRGFRTQDLTGKTFGAWVVVKFAGYSKDMARRAVWDCLCKRCKTRSNVYAYRLIEGKTKSCGCSSNKPKPKKAKVESNYRKHGLTKHPLYTTWSGMMSRCYNKNTKGYKYYGAKGVKVVKRWHKIENFIADMGEKPPYSTLDRKNPAGNYSPANCRWATPKQQVSNKRRKNPLGTGISYNPKMAYWPYLATLVVVGEKVLNERCVTLRQAWKARKLAEEKHYGDNRPPHWKPWDHPDEIAAMHKAENYAYKLEYATVKERERSGQHRNTRADGTYRHWPAKPGEWPIRNAHK